METSQEWYCQLKTSADRLPDLIAWIRRLHPYDVPEIVAVPIVAGDPDYLRWIEDSVTAVPPPPPPAPR